MNKKLAAALVCISSISMGQNSFNIPQLTEQIKNHPSTIEREKALNDLKIAGIVTVGAVSADLLVLWVKKAWEAGQTTNQDTGCPYIIADYDEIKGLPFWISVPWTLAEIAVFGYAALKGFQGAKHLLVPDHKLDAHETHVRVKRAE